MVNKACPICLMKMVLEKEAFCALYPCSCQLEVSVSFRAGGHVDKTTNLNTVLLVPNRVRSSRRMMATSLAAQSF
jgi:hypothetical protein